MVKAMLQGTYLESQTKVIELEEDNPTSFLNFCEILHVVFDNATPIDRAWFQDFLKIFDMRDAARGVESWVKDRLGEYFERVNALANLPWIQRRASQTAKTR